MGTLLDFNIEPILRIVLHVGRWPRAAATIAWKNHGRTMFAQGLGAARSLLTVKLKR